MNKGRENQRENRSEEQQRSYGTLERNTLIVQLVREGKPEVQVAKMFKLTRSRVNQIIQRAAQVEQELIGEDNNEDTAGV